MRVGELGAVHIEFLRTVIHFLDKNFEMRFVFQLLIK